MYYNICAGVNATATPTSLLDIQYRGICHTKGTPFYFYKITFEITIVCMGFPNFTLCFYAKTNSCRILTQHRRNSYVIINS